MLRNEKSIRIKLRADQFLVGATVLMMVALICYTPGQSLKADAELVPEQECAETIYSEDLDDAAIELIKQSNFEMIRRIQANNNINYEVYVKSPVTDLKSEAEALCKALEGLWEPIIPGATVRVLVLNYGDLELVDLMAENGQTVFRR